MSDSPMLGHIQSLPGMAEQVARTFDHAARETYSHDLCLSAKRVWLVGCGDGHHAAQSMEMLFNALTGIPTTALTAMKFSRYGATFLPATGPRSNLVIGITSSGKTSRTLEALQVVSPTNATTVALTAAPESEIAQIAQFVQPMVRPPIEGRGVPGVRSYLGMLLGLGFAALRISQVRGRLNEEQAARWRGWLRGMGSPIQATIDRCNAPTRQLAVAWKEHTEYHFLGSGPNYGTALVGAAHMLEATGDTAICQELEEWAHLQYWNRTTNSPAFVISAAQRDATRAVEVSAALGGLGHPVAAIVPEGEHEISSMASSVLPFVPSLPEELTPFVTCIPLMLFSAHRADIIGEPYFRRGSRPDPRTAGETSRVQSSERMNEVIPWSA